MIMREELLHFIWRYGLYDSANLSTADGMPMQIVYTGDYNTDSGPDFIAAQIQLCEVLLAGSIELHITQQDWVHHKHHTDPAYNNVILHVVFEGDGTPARLQSGHTAPVLILRDRIDATLLSRYALLQENGGQIPCESLIGSYEGGLSLTSYLNRLTVERMEGKVALIEQALKQSAHDWEQVAYQWIATYFGTAINKEAFTRLARSLPLQIIRKHIDQPIQVEALLYGQAGFLEQAFIDEYPAALRREYLYLRRLHSLTPIEEQSWKFFRIRPANFPTMKIAALAAFIIQTPHLFDALCSATTLVELRKIFEVNPNAYWKQHYRFDQPAHEAHTVGMGIMHSDILLINAVVPLLFAFGRYRGDEGLCERSLSILAEIPAERNTIIRHWESLGIQPANAADSQALLQLRHQYCHNHRCLQCSIGHRILQRR